MLYKNVVPGIHRVEQAYTNFYIIEEEGRLSIIDTGLPAGWNLMLDAIRELNFERKDIVAIAITHAHFDHLGFAERAQLELDVPIWIHKNDIYIAKYPYRYDHERSRLLYPVRHPRSIPMIARMVQAGGLQVKGVRTTHTFDDATGTLAIPGSPEVIHVPGHTHGQSAFYFSKQNALITGDALVTLNIYTGEKGPQIISGAATANSKQALLSLDKLTATGASWVLPGHGEPWTEGIERAVEVARQQGAS